MKTQDFIAMEDKYGAHNYHPLDVVVHKAKGIWVYDVEGNKYLDFLSSYSAVNQGHCHPRILKVMMDQAELVTLTSRAFRNDQLPLLYKEVAELTGMPRMLPMNSGAEAVETSIKAARKWGYKVKGIPDNKAEIIVCENNFHGRTTTIVGFSTEAQYQDGFGPFTPGFTIISYGDLDALKVAMNENTCAFMVEPIQGEAGIQVPPPGFLKGAYDLCKENNVLYILDEIQSGLGRTGKLFAYQHEEGIKPDGIQIGKAMSGGFYPVSAFLATEEVMGVFNPGDHGSTFGGNPLACAIAREALKILVEEGLIDRAQELGNYFMENLRTLKSDKIVEVRGKGLFIGLELSIPARSYCEGLMKEGLLCKETHENVIRFAPPLVIEKEDIDWAFERIKKVIDG